MTITAKYDSVCKKCNGHIPPGQQIEWSKEGGSQHLACPAAPAAKPAGKPHNGGAPRRPAPANFRYVQEAYDNAAAAVGAAALDAEHAAVAGAAPATRKTPGASLPTYGEALRKVTTDPARSSWLREAARVLDLGDPAAALRDTQVLLRLQQLRQGVTQ